MEDNDLIIRYTRGSGPGGQHKNKVETCVVITHKPTGLSVRCQETRSKNKNLELAKKYLEEKLEAEKDAKIKRIKGERRYDLIKNSVVIRTYNFARNEVIDHRSGKKYNLKKFLDGKVDLATTH